MCICVYVIGTNNNTLVILIIYFIYCILYTIYYILYSMLCVGQLTGGHDSTVVAIQFSPLNKYIASAGKDRTLCIHSYEPGSGSGVSGVCPYSTVICHKSAHKRIIWDLR